MGVAPSQVSVLSYAAVIDLLPVAAFMADPDGVVTYLSAGWEKLSGRTVGEIPPEEAISLVHPDERELVLEAWRRAIGDGSAYRAEYRMRSTDGSYRWMLARAVAMRGETGAVAAWFGTVVDTNDLHLVEEAMAHAISSSLASARDARARAEFSERLIEAGDDCVIVLDSAGRSISMSMSGRRSFGIADFSLVAGADWTTLWSHDCRAAAREAFASAIAGDRGRFTASATAGDRETWWDVSINPIRDHNGKPENALVVAREITDVLLAHRALAHSEERYRVLGDALPGLTFTATPDGKFDFMSEGGYGVSPASGLGDGWRDAIHPDDRERVVAMWDRSVKTGEAFEAQKRTRTSDGSYRWMLSRARPQYDETGAIVRWIGVGVDIDDQRRADEKREQFVRLAEASDDYIAMADLDGTITYMNAALLRALEVESLDEVLEHNRLEVFAPDDRAFFTNTIVPAQMREGRWAGEFRFRTFKTGTTIPLLYNTFVLRDDAGRPTGLASVSRDLRERRRLDIGMRALAETGAAMYGSLDFEGTIQNIAAAVVRSFASLCVVDTILADGTLRSVAASNRGPLYARTMQRAAIARNWKNDHPVWRAIRRAESTLIAKIPADWTIKNGMREAVGDAIDELDFRSMLFVPIRSQQDGSVYGSLSCILDGRDSRGYFGIDDLRFAEEIAVRAGLAFDHARAYERERRIAVTLQEASLPAMLPTVDHLYLSADYRPGSSEATIGGDWYDAFVLDDGRVAITIGDVLGNGLNAAVTMGKVRQAMQSVATVLAEPNAMLEVADRTVRAQSDDAYATAIAGIFDPNSHEFTFSSAGHPGPLIRRETGEIEDHTFGGVLLGMRRRGESETRTISVPPGSSLVFFTDGLTEATRDIDEGLRRIYAAMQDARVASADEPAYALVEHVLGGAPATDDIAVLVAEIGPRARFDARLRTARARARDIHVGTLAGYSVPLEAPESRGTVVSIEARLEEIVQARRAVRALLGNADASRELIETAELVTGELVANAVEHGTGTLVDVALRILPAAIAIAITNDGPVFQNYDTDLKALIYAERGRGLAILAALGCTIEIDTFDLDRCTVTATFAREAT